MTTFVNRYEQIDPDNGRPRRYESLPHPNRYWADKAADTVTRATGGAVRRVGCTEIRAFLGDGVVGD